MLTPLRRIAGIAWVVPDIGRRRQAPGRAGNPVRTIWLWAIPVPKDDAIHPGTARLPRDQVVMDDRWR
jgi:hypothetical protein